MRRYGSALGFWLLAWLMAGQATAEPPFTPPPALEAPPSERQDTDSKAEDLLAVARGYARAMEFDRAFETFQQALDASRRSGLARFEAESLLALGLTHRQAGAPGLAIPRIEEALQVYSRLRAPQEQAEVLCELARTLNAVARRRQARQHLSTAETLFRQLDRADGQGRVDSLRSLVAIHDRSYDEALHFGRRAVSRSATPQGDRLRALSSIAYALHQQGKLAQALNAYDDLVALAWERNDQGQLGFAFCNRAEVQWRLGNSKPALQDLWQTIHRFEQGRTLIPSTGAQRSDFIIRQVAAYDRLIRYLVDTSQAQRAFEVAERLHGRSFLEMLDQRAEGHLQRRDPELLRRRQQLLEALGRARLALDEGEAPPPGDSSLQPEPVAEAPWRRQIDRLEGELLAVEGQLLWRHRDLRRQPTPPYPSLQQVQEGLEPGEALVAYWLSDQRIFVWTVLDGTIRWTQIVVSKPQLAAALETYLAPLRSHRLAEDLALVGGEDEHLAAGRQLYDWLIGRLPPEILAARRWVLIPDDLLHYLPFEALVSGCSSGPPSQPDSVHGRYADCQYLGLQTPLAYSASAGTFLALRQRYRDRLADPPSSRASLLALAPSGVAMPPAAVDGPAEEIHLRRGLSSRAPLRYARQEAEGIAALFPDADAWLEGQASEGRLKTSAGRFRFLHLATHGLVSDSLPMSSGLLLAPDSGEDGLLQAHEVLGLELGADLVTLSACRTGRGRLQRGEGIVGLSRAFLTAGASAVLVSLWDIDDRSTPLFMEAFYRHLAVGIPAPEALVKARRGLFGQQGEVRLVLRQRPLSYAHPRFWASFVFSGGC